MNNKTTLLYPILLHSSIALNIIFDLRIELISEVKSSLDNDFHELKFEIDEL